MDAVAAVDDVGVAVDEAGHRAHAARVDHLGVIGQLHQSEDVLARADGLDVPVPDCDRRVVLDAEVAVRIDRGEGGEVVDQEVRGLHAVSLRPGRVTPVAQPAPVRAKF